MCIVAFDLYIDISTIYSVLQSQQKRFTEVICRGSLPVMYLRPHFYTHQMFLCNKLLISGHEIVPFKFLFFPPHSLSIHLSIRFPLFYGTERDENGNNRNLSAFNNSKQRRIMFLFKEVILFYISEDVDGRLHTIEHIPI